MEIVSTMGTGSLGRELDLRPLVDELVENTEAPIDANFTSDGMVTIRLEKGGPAFILYRTGTFQIRGATDEDHLAEAANQIVEVLLEMGVRIQNYQFSHVTSVFMEDLEREVNLEAMTIVLGMENTEYEPEQFPGLVYRPPGFDVTLLVFASGKVIIGGTIDRQEANAAIEELRDELVDVDII